MQKELIKLFDFQKFQNNKKMEEIISNVEKKYKLDSSLENELSDDELDLYAAGDINTTRIIKDDDK